MLAVLGDRIDEPTVRSVWTLYEQLRRTLGGSVLDIVPAYSSVIVRFDPSRTTLAAIMASVRGVLEMSNESPDYSVRAIEVGVDFRGEFALDLDDVARHAGLSKENLIEEFCKPVYRVAFLGFTAGFPYLTGLPQQLSLPRLPTPRVRVPAGSVAVVGAQCGIYPRESPGGWRVVGRTAAAVFDPDRDPPALFAPGDKVRFYPASLDRAIARVLP